MKKILLPICLCALLYAEADVHSDFEARRTELNAPWCFEAFDQDLEPELRQALEFLYAYMPLPDVTDYPAEYFIDNACLALRARQEMPWGEIVPDREWLHFVLPVRVNNENLDGHRAVFYEELKDRVAGMSMEEAILEVNHWCHEKVTYEPSDARTHSPLASVSSGIGRCGEESTFTVAALRSIGIPARQVYTPRWAHTDDNHAWVEAWANGQWHFLGACEPEAVLDLGWFNAPASRGMLMTTRALGKYDGPEEKLLQADKYTDINVTSNYAPTGKAMIQVTTPDFELLDSARVDFCLYNYGEFYPIATKYTDDLGIASIECGIGDLIVWASKDGKYSFAKIKAEKNPEVGLLPIADEVNSDVVRTFDIVPPKASASLIIVDPQEAAACNLRKAQEDSIRMAYVGTFTSKARGNQAVIDEFLSQWKGTQQEWKATGLISALCDKDLTDISLDVLNDAMLAPQSVSDSLYLKYVLPPRVELEYLRPNREAFLQANQGKNLTISDLKEKYSKDISAEATWQPASVRMDPKSVGRLGLTDRRSRDIAMVSEARAMGLPARIDPVSGKAQYFDAEGQCYDFWNEDGDQQKAPEGWLQLNYDREGYVENPEYYIHFTISKIVDGRPQLLNYDEGETWRSGFAEPRRIDTGDYMLVSGQRLADGGVLAQVEFFTVDKDQLAEVPLALRQDNEGVKVIGNFNSEDLYYDLNAQAEKSLLSTTGRGYYILGLMAMGQEPSNHALRDISAMASALEATGCPMVLLFPSEKEASAWTQANTLALPASVAIGADIDGSIRKELAENLHLDNVALPIVVIADTFNRVVFVSEGYTIGMGKQLLETLRKLE